MNIRRIFGIVLLAVGIILVIVGINASHSTADQLGNTFPGRFTHNTAWYIFWGSAVALFGLLAVVIGTRERRA